MLSIPENVNMLIELLIDKKTGASNSIETPVFELNLVNLVRCPALLRFLRHI